MVAFASMVSVVYKKDSSYTRDLLRQFLGATRRLLSGQMAWCEPCYQVETGNDWMVFDGRRKCFNDDRDL
jgi:hypothetical protein